MSANARIVAAGVASACLVGVSFVPSPSANGAAQPLSHGFSEAPALRSTSSADGALGAAAPLAAAGVLGLALMMAGQRRGRASRVVAKGVSKDEEMPALVPSEQLGATKPFGFFDPLGFTKSPLMTFKNDPNGFKHLREAEIKHGRVAMMASVGSVVAHYVKMPGFEGVPSGLAALGTSAGTNGFAALLLCVGLLEASRWVNPSDEPGSYGDPFNFDQYTEEMRNRELNNGRMAMFALMGQIAAEMATGLDPVQQFGL